VAVGQIVLACDEATTNVFRHGYGATSGPLTYHAEIDDARLTIQIVDNAKPIDLTKVKGRKLSDLRPGGLGTVIMAQVFDEVKYEPLARGTSLTNSHAQKSPQKRLSTDAISVSSPAHRAVIDSSTRASPCSTRPVMR